MGQMQRFPRGNIKGTMSALPQKRMFAVAIGVSALCQKHLGSRQALRGILKRERTQDLARFRRFDHGASKAGGAFGRIRQLI